MTSPYYKRKNRKQKENVVWTHGAFDRHVIRIPEPAYNALEIGGRYVPITAIIFCIYIFGSKLVYFLFFKY